MMVTPFPLTRVLPAAFLLAFSAQAAPSASVAVKDAADAAFERGDYTTAAAMYSAALSENPALGRELAFKDRLARAQSGACCEAAERFMASGNGGAALAQVREAVMRDPGWERPKQLLPKAEVCAADAGYARACKLADAGRPEEVTKQLAQVLALVPKHAKAQAASALFAQKPPAGSAWDKAVLAAGKKDWSAAETAWRAVLQADADHLPARAGLAQAREAQAGARQLLEGAQVALQAGQLETAREKLAQAQAKWPGVPFGLALRGALRERRETAHSALAQGAASAQKAAWIEAQTAYREALRQDPESKTAQAGLVDAVCREADDLAAHGRPGAALLVCRRGRGLAAAVDRRAEVLAKALRQEGMPTLQWKVEGEKAPAMALSKALSAVTDSWGAGAASVVHAKIIIAEASRRKLSQEAKAWSSFTEREEVNPAYVAVQTKLDLVEQRRARAEAAYAQAGQGHGDLSQAEAQVNQWRQAEVDLVVERSHIPMLCRVRQEHVHPYTEEVWQAKGRLVVAFTLDGGDPVVREAVYDQSDAVRLGAKPEAGGADKPELPASEAAITGDLVQRLAAEWMPLLHRKTVVSRVVLLAHAAGEAERNGDGAGALELRVKAAVLTGLCAPTLAEKELRKLE